ncbi:MAG: sigma-54-dependent Fis family transcriptional regulator, partial [Candidatus Electrothrix sp. AS4_5]|nr:sigma-54-dependent Fis family transcriptional regulator [Candidatus Electrothrix gigas]
MSSTILIIDDEAPIREVLSGILSDEGFHPLSAASAEEGLTLMEYQDVHLVLLDIWLPGMDGIAALEKIKQDGNDVPVIMISGHGTIETAVQATRIGAFDFIEKPLSYDKVILAITQGLRFAQLEQENKLLRETKSSSSTSAIIGDSAVVNHLCLQI